VRVSRIPRILHQSWKDEHIPYDIYKKCWVESWMSLHSGWQRMFWTDADNLELVRAHYPQFQEAYRQLTPSIKQADFARFLYMHRFGGVYVDLDFVSLRPLEPLLADYDIVLGCLSDDNDYYRIPNAFLASSPGSDFWLRVAQDALHASPSEQQVERHTGPFRLQQGLLAYRPANTVIYSGELIYPIDWIHLTHGANDRYFRPERAELHRRAQSMTPAELAALFPESYCLTFWTHNW
jgi:mannosyltransferase OCH1-like enzyme